jgi:hypothetical protein
VLGQISVDGGLQARNRAKYAGRMRWRVILEKKFSTALSQEAGWGEVERPARMARQLGQHLGMFVSGVVVEYGVDELAGRDLARQH